MEAKNCESNQLVFRSNMKCSLVECELLSNMWLSTLEISMGQLCSSTEITPKSLFSHVYVNRGPMQYGFRAGAKAIWYALGANIALIYNVVLLQ